MEVNNETKATKIARALKRKNYELKSLRCVMKKLKIRQKPAEICAVKSGRGRKWKKASADAACLREDLKKRFEADPTNSKNSQRKLASALGIDHFPSC